MPRLNIFQELIVIKILPVMLNKALQSVIMHLSMLSPRVGGGGGGGAGRPRGI